MDALVSSDVFLFDDSACTGGRAPASPGSGRRLAAGRDRLACPHALGVLLEQHGDLVSKTN
jgi:hypothetical protein